MKAFRTPIAAVTCNVYLCGVGCITTENLQNKGLQAAENIAEISLKPDIIDLNTNHWFKGGITHVLNTAEELEDFRYPSLNLKVRHILMRDSDEQDLLKCLDECVDHIHQVSKTNGHILVHCVAGVSRSASVCIAYLMRYKGMTLKKAFYHVFNKRPCIHPNFGFWRQLVQYEEQIHGKTSVELLPLIIGLVPDIMKNDAEYKMKIAWMPDLVQMFSIHSVILMIQIVSLYFFS